MVTTGFFIRTNGSRIALNEMNSAARNKPLHKAGLLKGDFTNITYQLTEKNISLTLVSIS
jgi:hypothetical protein